MKSSSNKSMILLFVSSFNDNTMICLIFDKNYDNIHNSVIKFANEKGQFEVSMQLYRDDQFDKQYSSSPTVIVGAYVYVQVSLIHFIFLVQKHIFNNFLHFVHLKKVLF